MNRMAIKQTPQTRVKNPCPECESELLVIDGQFVKWFTCPNCKFRKLSEKTEKIKVVSLK